MYVPIAMGVADSIWHNGIEVDKKWDPCPKCKDGIVREP